MLTITGAALVASTSAGFWYLLPRNGKEHPLVRNNGVGLHGHDRDPDAVHHRRGRDVRRPARLAAGLSPWRYRISPYHRTISPNIRD